MEDYYTHQKPFCREGESESHYALGAAALTSPLCLTVWVLFLWAIGVISP